MKEELSKGFRLGDTLIAWGTLVGELSGMTGSDGAEDGGNGALHLPCPHTYGFATIAAELTGPDRDRPVTGVTYELAPIGQRGGTGGVIAMLSERLGRPIDSGHESVPAYAESSGCVVEWARWRLGDVEVGVSIYGALRAVQGGMSAGMLWISWSDEAAARPFQRDWLDRSANLEAVSTRLTAVRSFVLDLPQHPLFGPTNGSVSLAPGSAAERRRIASLSLRRRRILATPTLIAARLSLRDFAIWSSSVDRLWCISTRWDSLAHGIGEPVAAMHVEIKPAKGGGYVLLEVGDWSVRACYPSSEIAAAAAQLAAMPGVELRLDEGYDC